MTPTAGVIPYAGEDRRKPPGFLERERLKAEWAEQRGVTESHAHGHPAAWLLGKRCDDAPCVHWFDHGTRWLRAGQPYCLLGQPYDLSADDLAELHELQARGLHVSITTWPSWHYPGAVLSVLVNRHDIRPWE